MALVARDDIPAELLDVRLVGPEPALVPMEGRPVAPDNPMDEPLVEARVEAPPEATVALTVMVTLAADPADPGPAVVEPPRGALKQDVAATGTANTQARSLFRRLFMPRS